MEEIVEAIQNLSPGKAPGPNGFSAEFYKTYVQELSPLLLDMYCEAMDRGGLPPSLYDAVISLILKKDKDSLDCKSYRPISLIGCETKILAKILGAQLNKAIATLIHSDQVGFIRSHTLADNFRHLINIMWTTSSKHSPAAALSLDAEKAFDRVEWQYLFSILEFFGFCKKFLGWINLLYTHPRASVLTNGVLSQPFELNRCMRQGCPLSPLVFVLRRLSVLSKIVYK